MFICGRSISLKNLETNFLEQQKLALCCYEIKKTEVLNLAFLLSPLSTSMMLQMKFPRRMTKNGTPFEALRKFYLNVEELEKRAPEKHFSRRRNEHAMQMLNERGSVC